MVLLWVRLRGGCTRFPEPLLCQTVFMDAAQSERRYAFAKVSVITETQIV
jgi:hypothetical protein